MSFFLPALFDNMKITKTEREVRENVKNKKKISLMGHWDKESEQNGKFIFWHFFLS